MSNLRPPKPLFERAKLPFLLALYIGIMEWVDPFPFYASLPARLAVVALAFFVFRELWHARLEIDAAWAERSERTGKRWRLRATRINRRTWLRLQRIVVWILGTLIFGALLNSITDRCDSAVQCAVTAPRMALENLPTFIQFAVFIAITLLQLAVMFWALIKVGSWKLVMPGTIDVTFDDVWGQDIARDKVREQVRLLEDSTAVEKAGGYMPKGILLWGPPGTGKTLLAKAAAGESSKPLILVPPGAFQSTFVGINLLKVWMLFRNIRKLARRYGGVTVFIDEIDSLGSRGGEVAGAKIPARSLAPGCVPFSAEPEPSEPRRIVLGTAQMGTLEAFLSALDGMDEPRGLLNRLLVFAGFKPLRPPEYKALFMGATNMPDLLDPALLRAGRLSRKIHVPYPKVEGRLRTYEGYFSRVTHELTPQQIEWAARNHERGTGAEIKDIVNEALLLTFRDERDEPGIVRYQDLVQSMVWVRFGEGEGPFEREFGRWSTAIHEAGHAVAFHYLFAERLRIWFATIERRGQTGGMVVPTNLDDDWTLMRSEMLAEIQVSFASRVAEMLFFDEASNGNGGDNRAATEMARQMVQTGLGGQIGALAEDREMRRQVEAILAEALTACTDLLTPRKDEIERVARLLYERQTLPGDEIHALLAEGGTK